MSLQFRAIRKPLPSILELVAAAEPANPFCAPAYVTARGSLGEQACLLGLFNGEGPVTACAGFLSGFSLRRQLEIPSLPTLADAPAFWRGLWQCSHDLRLWRLHIGSFGSSPAQIPSFDGEMERRSRREYVLHLDREPFLKGLSHGHRYSIARAQKAGLSVRRSREVADSTQHLAMMRASLARRAKRGEKVPLLEGEDFAKALLASGAGELFQALNGDRVVSSMLVLRSRLGAYYQSAGTASEGIELGASPFLIAQTAALLKQEGVTTFNLGGAAADTPGLRRFKAGFGTEEVDLEAASFCPRSRLQRGIYTTLRSYVALLRSL